MKAGDVLLKLDGTEVLAPGDVSSAIRSAKNRRAISILFLRDHKEMTVTASVGGDE